MRLCLSCLEAQAGQLSRGAKYIRVCMGWVQEQVSEGGYRGLQGIGWVQKQVSDEGY